MKRSFENSIVIEAAPEAVWKALTDPEELNRWETTEAHLDLRVGGGFLYVYAYGPSRPGTFLVVDPPRRLVQENIVFNHNASYRYVNSNTLEEVADGTRVTILVEGYGDGDDEQWLRESMDLGWETDLKILKAYVERGEDLRPQLWRGLLMGIRYVSVAPDGDGTSTASGNGRPGRGIRVLEALPGKPAAQAGLAADDVVVAVDGEEVTDFRGFRAALEWYEPGDEAVFAVVREGRELKARLRFGDAR